MTLGLIWRAECDTNEQDPRQKRVDQGFNGNIFIVIPMVKSVQVTAIKRSCFF